MPMMAMMVMNQLSMMIKKKSDMMLPEAMTILSIRRLARMLQMTTETMAGTMAAKMVVTMAKKMRTQRILMALMSAMKKKETQNLQCHLLKRVTIIVNGGGRI